MSLNKSRTSALSSLAASILNHLGVIAETAKSRLSASRRPTGQGSALMGGANTMAGSPAAQYLSTAVGTDRVEIERLSREPFVARVACD